MGSLCVRSGRGCPRILSLSSYRACRWVCGGERDTQDVGRLVGGMEELAEERELKPQGLVQGGRTRVLVE